jgi:hypothetical protein
MQKQLLDGIVGGYSLKLYFTGKFFEYNANSDRICDYLNIKTKNAS